MHRKMKENKKGITLAELLIVVAIIAVLVAISIPIFTSQLEKSRDAVSISNIRAAYAEAQTSWLTGSNGENATIDKAKKTVTVAKIVTKGTSGTDFSGEGKELPDTNLKNLAEPAAGEHELIFEYNDDGSIKSVAWATGTTMNN